MREMIVEELRSIRDDQCSTELDDNYGVVIAGDLSDVF